MNDKKKSVYIDWDALKLKPITPEQKKSQKLSAIGKRKAKIMKEIHEDMSKSFIKPDLFNNKGRKR
mgnify:FL=1|jgi:hypothetical protein|tara:strand:+ start:28 stop:225 length:198 start_codon:yes stop_codon:yes gene_type:complete